MRLVDRLGWRSTPTAPRSAAPPPTRRPPSWAGGGRSAAWSTPCSPPGTRSWPSSTRWSVDTPACRGRDVVVFHMDEYVGRGARPSGRASGVGSGSGSVSRVPARAVHYIDGLADPVAECARYAGAAARPSPRPVLPRHRRERPPGVQRSARRRLRRPARRQGRRARPGLPAPAGRRGALPRPRRGPDPGHDRDHPRPAAGRRRDRGRARGAQGRAGAGRPARTGVDRVPGVRAPHGGERDPCTSTADPRASCPGPDRPCGRPRRQSVRSGS